MSSLPELDWYEEQQRLADQRFRDGEPQFGLMAPPSRPSALELILGGALVGLAIAAAAAFMAAVMIGEGAMEQARRPRRVHRRR